MQGKLQSEADAQLVSARQTLSSMEGHKEILPKPDSFGNMIFFLQDWLQRVFNPLIEVEVKRMTTIYTDHKFPGAIVKLDALNETEDTYFEESLAFRSNDAKMFRGATLGFEGAIVALHELEPAFQVIVKETHACELAKHFTFQLFTATAQMLENRLDEKKVETKASIANDVLKLQIEEQSKLKFIVHYPAAIVGLLSRQKATN